MPLGQSSRFTIVNEKQNTTGQGFLLTNFKRPNDMIKTSPLMARLIKVGLTVLLAFVPFLVKAQVNKAQPTYPKATIINTEQRQLFSKLSNQEYELYISLPDNYVNSDSTYQVIYLTDANQYFGLMADITRSLQWGSEMPEAIVVGIGYPLSSFKTDDERWSRWLAWRMRDLSPTNTAQMDKDFGMENIKSGGAFTFLQFMEQELFPFVEKNYRAKSKDRTFVGFSLGGLFGLYSLFQKPGLFQNYVLGSPSIWSDNKAILRIEETYADNHKDLTGTVFMSAGELEEEINAGMVRNMLEMNSILKSRQYKSLHTDTAILEGETHMSAPSVCFQRGLRYLFRK
jgi:predicted alpha/beta superfamily hydrolase